MFNSEEILNILIMNEPNFEKTTGLKRENQTEVLNSVKFEEEVHVCPLCGKSYIGWGNNPYPLDIEPVCGECNWNYILPLRLKLITVSEIFQELYK